MIISAPMEGIVTRRNIEEGETAVIGTMNNAGTVLLEIADMSVIERRSRSTKLIFQPSSSARWPA